MPKKTTTVSDDTENLGSEEAKPKTKKRTTRKVKKGDEPDLSSLPNSATPVHMDSIARPVSADTIHNKHHVVPEAADQYEAMQDIKPRAQRSDATFLVPEKFGFDLKGEQKKSRKAKSNFVKTLATVLVVLIILLAGALYYLNSYSKRIITDTSNNVAVETPDTTNVAPATYTLALSGVSADLKPTLTSLLTNKFGKDWGYADYTGTLPTVTTDTLFVKDSAEQKNLDLINELASYGITPEVQQSDITSAAVLILTPTVAKPDVSGQVAGVYNASGTTGLAKKTCDTLLSYKAVSCQPLNSNGTQSGTTVNYKNVKALFMLKRTAAFAKAKFSPADAKQVEDIRVTLGK